MLSKQARALLTSLVALALLVALPAFGESASSAAASQVLSPTAGCTRVLSWLDPAPDAGLVGWLDSASASGKASPLSVISTQKFRGFCPCGCSFVPDCNTSADCFGGAQCQTAPSCC